MSRVLTTDYSEFKIHKLYFKLKATGSSFAQFGCTGSLERTYEVQTITKKCEGVTVKNITKPNGTGSLTISAHAVVDAVRKMQAMVTAHDVTAQGTNTFPAFELKCEVENEDGEVMYQHYPNCSLSEAPTVTIDNSADEVAEVEYSIALAVDSAGYMFYEAFNEDLTNATIATVDLPTTFAG